jgi:uncharacterized protein (UPF0332 family)
MQPGTDKLLRKAERAARSAAGALEAGVTATAAARAFYAMLYAAKAMLNERGFRLRAHAGIVAALARSVGPDTLRLNEWLVEALDRRQAVEGGELTYDEVAQLVERARDAVAIARDRVGAP